MRIPPEIPINSMALFWYLVYSLALFLIFVTGILAGSRDPKRPPQRTNQKNKTRIRMFMKTRMLAIMAALLAGAGICRADNITNINIWDNNRYRYDLFLWSSCNSQPWKLPVEH